MDDEQPPSDTSHLDPASRRVGTVLDGKWTLERLLGVGGMAAVYQGTHRNGARAAIKLFPFSVTTSAEFAERILREGHLANRIGHPAVVNVLDDHLDREHEYAYLVMELLEGETARQRVERGGPMSPIEAARFMISLADCLSAAHEKGVVHRDIKPENLFLTHEGKLKVLDFGVARALDGTSSSVTRTGTMLGTPAYMSPEQARGKPSEISPRSDIYSAGATLLFLVAGEFLHEGESAQEIMVRAAWTPAKKIRDRGLGLPDSIADIIDRSCEFEASDRYASAADLRAALEAAVMGFVDDPAASRPVARTSKIPVSGPISTAPLPLSRSAHGVTTVTALPELAANEFRSLAQAPASSGPPSSSSSSSVRPRWTLWAMGGALALALVAIAVALWPDPAPRVVSSPAPETAPPGPAKTEPESAETAGAEPRSPEPPGAIPLEQIPPDAPQTRRRSTSPVRPIATTKPGAQAAATAAPHPAAVVGRDIGY